MLGNSYIYNIYKHKMGKRINITIGTMYGYYKVIDDNIYMVKNKNNNYHRGHIKVRCTLCNTEHLIRFDVLKRKEATKCRACSNKEKYLENVKNKVIAHKGYSVGHQGTGDLTKSYLYSIKQGAKSRNLEFDESYMTTENLWNLLIKQNHKCKLSGLDITLSRGKNIPTTSKSRNIEYSLWNASLDRIDSTKGYTKENVQWVERSINRMKMSLPNDYFIKLCIHIANNANQQPSAT